MTVRANKPAFSIREKLKELDYAHVPYDKIAPGAVVQTVFHFAPDSPAGAENETTSTSYTDANITKFNFTPKFRNSKIILVWYIQTKTTDSDTSYQYVRTRKTIDGVESDAGTGEGAQLFFQGTIGAGNHISYGPVSAAIVDTPNTLSTIEYKLQQKVTGDAQTVRIGENGQNSELLCVATEIRQ
jgi:hypothetical protein